MAPMQRRVSRQPVALLGLLLALLGGALPGAAQQAAVVGRVVDAGSLAPLAGAQVFVAGSGLGTLSDAEGRYRLPGVPPGAHQIRVALVGYRTTTLPVTVQAGQSVTVDFAIPVAAISLDEVVVTATGEQQRRELANAVATIQTADVATSPITDLKDMLTGRAAGVNVVASAGTTGTGSRIRIRGSSSVSLSNAPLIYVDGARIGSSEDASSLNLGGQTTARFNDLNPDEIESIEIVKGPSAATLYGTQAANGVIRIRTKRGRQGSSATFWTETGVLQERNDYPAVYRAVSASGAICPLSNVADGRCQQSDVQVYDLLKNPETTPFRDGSRLTLGGNVSGAREGLQYFLSGEREMEDGVLENNTLRKMNLRANLGVEPREGLSLSLNTGFVSSELRLPNADNSSLGVLGQGLLTADPSPTGWWRFTPEQLFQIETFQDVMRFTGSLSGSWQAFPWLTARASAGSDFTNRHDHQFIPVGVIDRGRELLGVRVSNRYNELISTVELTSTANLDVTPWLNSQTSLGAQYFREHIRGTTASGEELVAGTNSLAAAALTSAQEQTLDSKTLGAFVQQQVGLRDRLFLTGAVRWDDNSTFGRNFDMVVYPKLSASWVVAEEPFFPESPLLTALRLRAAWGESGNQPGVTDAILFMRGVPITTPSGVDAIGVTFQDGGLGNPNLKPERSSEVEAGFDVSLLYDRVGLEFTVYDKRTSDALVFRNVAPSVGAVGGRFENIGRVRNRGVEALVTALLVDHPRARLDLTLSGSANRNTLLDLGGVPPISSDGGGRHVEGFPLGGYWDRPILAFGDANGDGIIAPSEITLGDTLAFIGSSAPRREISVQPSLTLLEHVVLTGMIDYRGGHHLNNSTGSFRCGRAIDFARNDPAAPLEEQARCIASAFLGSNHGYIEEADFVKLRELSLTLTAPPALAGRLHTGRLSLTLAARNLATWTDYSGIDPEVNRFSESNFGTAEFLTQPPVRYWTARVNVQF